MTKDTLKAYDGGTKQKNFEELREIRRTHTHLFNFLFAVTLWVQVPQWSDDWSHCAVDVPDTSCHWYIVNADNTFGEGFDWETAPWYSAEGLLDIADLHDETLQDELYTVDALQTLNRNDSNFDNAKVINVIALIRSDLYAFIGGSVYVVMNQDAWREERKNV